MENIINREEFLKLLSDEKDNTINGKCSNCGQCCIDHLLVSQEELIYIVRYKIFTVYNPITM